MKRLSYIFGVFTLLVFFQSCIYISNKKESNYMEASASSRFMEIQKSFVERPEEIKQYGAEEAYKIIVRNIESFEKLKKKVQNANSIAVVLDEVADELAVIASNYREVSNMAGKIERFTINSMDQLTVGQSASNKSIKSNDDIIRQLTQEMEAAKLKLERADDSNEIMRLKATVAGNASQINSLKSQNMMWLNFVKYQEGLLGALGDNNEAVSTLLFVLEKNADVYERAAETALMTKSAARFIQDLNGLIDINNTLGDLMDSWDEVDIMVGEISSLDFATL